MTGPRKRTLPAVTTSIITVALLLGGTGSSHADSARDARRSAKNHSTSVQRQPHNASTRSTSSRSHATGASDRLDEALIREALERRQAWTERSEPRRDLLQTAGAPWAVKDPPAGQGYGASQIPVQAPTFSVDEPRLDDSGMLAAGQPRNPRNGNEDLIREALRNRGQPYVWGGASRGGFDCSGFICYLFRKQRGMKLPHSASAQSRMGSPVHGPELQSGDLVFFTTYRPGVSHVGIYLGENRFIHAANHIRNVRIDSLTGYYERRLVCARRLSPAPLKFSPRDLQDYLKEPGKPPSDEDLIDP